MTDALIEAAASVFLYGLPLYEVARTRGVVLTEGQCVNQIRHVRSLVDARSRWVTTPNVDTLYSTAWLDLTDGPVEIDLPARADRYVSLALMDAFSNNFAILHPADPGAPRFTLVGPDGAGATGAGRTLLRSPTKQVWALARVYAAGEADVGAARGVQDAFRVAGPASRRVDREPTEPAMRGDVAAVFAGIAALVRANRKLDEDAPVLESLAMLAGAPVSVLEAGRAAAWRQMRVRDQQRHGAWIYPRSNLGDFGRDYLFRAQVAIGGLAALPVREAAYLRAVMGESTMFRGGNARRLRFAPDAAPPLRDFWSLTLYEPDGTGALFFFDNPERVYAIKNLDPDYRCAPDGSAEIVIAPTRPDDPGVNWLPAPSGPFALVLRAYGPEPALLDGSYRFPAVEPA